MIPGFTSETFPDAVKDLFKLNHYEVTGPMHVHGAEIDLRARSMSDPFAPPIYIEATIEHVDTEKYGKDLTKFALMQHKEPGCQCLLISSTGFTKEVRERAQHSQVITLTYTELFSKFQRVSPYVSLVLDEGSLASELSNLDKVYVEPQFDDSHGSDGATAYLDKWLSSNDRNHPWLIVVGEYGTGKTALTKVLLRRWMERHRAQPSLPMPFRMELRDFTKQFDAAGLLHQFLDKNNLQHLPIDFVKTMVSSGKVVLLLDGYDEMAQYMHVRERRACLQALAELAGQGARGILTSRPNYFSEAEELRVLEVLYSGAENLRRLKAYDLEEVISEERNLDALFQVQFLERHERRLQDLNDEQTEQLVSRILKDDAKARSVVMKILKTVFRTEDDIQRSLSGKPVIVTYLIQVAEELKNDTEAIQTDNLTEWAVYALITRKLMRRDFMRAPELSPDAREKFLQRLAILQQRKQVALIDDEEFSHLAVDHFSSLLKRSALERPREDEVDRLLVDLRSSSTLTRDSTGGLRFSHNSLREFLCASYLTESLVAKRVPKETIVVTDAMRAFVASLEREQLLELTQSLASMWSDRINSQQLGGLLNLIFDGVMKLTRDKPEPHRAALEMIAGSELDCDHLTLNRLALSIDSRPARLSSARFSNSTLVDVSMTKADCRSANFSSAILDGVSFNDADLGNANFDGALLYEVDLTDANVLGSSFRDVGDVIRIIDGSTVWEGEDAVGFLAFNGASTDPVPACKKLQHSSRYGIVDKICRKLLGQQSRQYLGLTQKGAAHADTAFAKEFVDLLLSEGIARRTPGRAGQVELTEEGRSIISQIVDKTGMPPAIQQLFERP